MRYSKAKSILISELPVETSSHYQEPHLLVIGGSAIFQAIKWPKHGTVAELIETKYQYIKDRLVYQDVFFVFNRYRLYSIKGSTRENRIENIENHHYLKKNTLIKALSSSSNTTELIDLTLDFASCKVAANRFQYLLVIIQSQDTPTEISPGNITHRDDLATTLQEADVIIVEQCQKLIESWVTTVKVNIVSDDTDVFALASHFFPKERYDVIVLMEPNKARRTVTDIGATVQKYVLIIDALLVAHVLSGCDTVC